MRASIKVEMTIKQIDCVVMCLSFAIDADGAVCKVFNSQKDSRKALVLSERLQYIADSRDKKRRGGAHD